MASHAHYTLHDYKEALATLASGEDALGNSWNVTTSSKQLTPLGYRQITSLGSAASLGTIPAGAKVAAIKAETHDVRYRDDGVDPTASVGMPLLTTDAPREYRGDLSAIKFIEQASGAKLNVSFYS